MNQHEKNGHKKKEKNSSENERAKMRPEQFQRHYGICIDETAGDYFLY